MGGHGPAMTGEVFRPPVADESRKLRELEFLHEFAKLLTTARNWGELMRTIVDRTTDALSVEVCSVYLMERDGASLRLAATNGLDRDQVGKVTLSVGEGLTGKAAESGRPMASPDVRVDPRFKWVPGFDESQFTSMLSVPLPWNDRIVGVINVQAIERREFSAEEMEFLVTIGALLGGVVEKGRLQAEAEEQLETLTALDGARAELLAVVTHELRTPLAIVRAYLDLLADSAVDAVGEPLADLDDAGDAARLEPTPGMRVDAAQIEEWRSQAIAQVTRLDRLVDSILASVRGEGLTGLRREPFDVVASIGSTVGTLALLLRTRPVRWQPPEHPLVARGDEARFRQVLEQLLDNEAKYAPPEQAVSIGTWAADGEVHVYVTDDGPGVPIEDWEAVFQPYVRVDRARSRGSGIGLFAARRLMEGMGGRCWIEPNGYGGSRFVVALPAA